MRTADALAPVLSAVLSLSCGNVGGNPDAGGPDIDADNSDAASGTPDAAPPTLSTIVPDWGPLAGGTEVTITGSGFSDAGDVTVTFGANDGTDVNVVSDTELTVVTPNGPHIAVPVTVSNDNGTSGGLMFRYLAALYAAPSMTNKQGTLSGDLYSVNPATAATVSIGALGIPVTGMTLSPGGIIYAVRPGVWQGGGPAVAGPIPGIAPVPVIAELYTINPYTATPTLVGQMHNSSDQLYNQIAAIAFVGNTMYGWTEDGPLVDDVLVTIDPATAEVTDIANPSAISSAQTAFTVDTTGRLLATFNNGVINIVDVSTGALTPGATLSPNGGYNAITFVGSQMYGARRLIGGPALALEPGGVGNTSELDTIDTTTGTVATVGPLPNNIDSLLGVGTIAAAAPPPAAKPAARAPVRASAPAPVPSALTVRAGDRVLLAGVPAALALAPLADGVKGAKAMEIATATDSLRVDLATARARGLRLKLNQRGLYKLMDGAGIKLGEGVVSVKIID